MPLLAPPLPSRFFPPTPRESCSRKNVLCIFTPLPRLISSERSSLRRSCYPLDRPTILPVFHVREFRWRNATRASLRAFAYLSLRKRLFGEGTRLPSFLATFLVRILTSDFLLLPRKEGARVSSRSATTRSVEIRRASRKYDKVHESASNSRATTIPLPGISATTFNGRARFVDADKPTVEESADVRRIEFDGTTSSPLDRVGQSIIVILGELVETQRLHQDESITRWARTTVTTGGRKRDSRKALVTDMEQLARSNADPVRATLLRLLSYANHPNTTVHSIN